MRGGARANAGRKTEQKKDKTFLGIKVTQEKYKVLKSNFENFKKRKDLNTTESITYIFEELIKEVQ